MRLFRPQITIFYKPLIYHLTYLLVTFLLFFPKGGIKVGTIPITWGYLLLACLGGFLALKNQFILTKERLIVLIYLIPFQGLCMISLFFKKPILLESLVSHFVNVIALPYIFLIFLAEPIEKIDKTFFFTLIKRGIFFVSIYGIILFFFAMLTGTLFEIPILTTNFHDMGTIGDKSNNRGIVYKLVSTYNNGNIYGICILMLLPLYTTIEKSLIKRNLVKLSLLLTLSRTVWAGLIFVELGYSLYVNRNKYSFIKIGLFLVTFASGLLFLVRHFNFGWKFLWDKTIGGREMLFTQLSNISPFASTMNILGDPVYHTIMLNFGLVGLFCFLIFISAGLMIYQMSPFPHSPLRKSILLGLVGYLFISISDGAFLYLPIFAFYWCLSSLLLSRADLQSAAPSVIRPS